MQTRTVPKAMMFNKIQSNPVLMTSVYLVYSVRYSRVPIKSSLLTTISYYSVRTTLPPPPRPSGVVARSGSGPPHDHIQLDTPQSVGLLWTRDQPDAEAST
jgi:hypothetical protein